MRIPGLIPSLSLVGALALVGMGCGASSPATGGTGGSGAGGTSGANCITVADDLIADFMTDNGIHPADGRSGGFYVYGDPLGAFDPPKMGDNPYPIDTVNGNPNCSNAGSLRLKAAGFKVWGSAAGTDFKPKVGAFKQPYDATKYKGVSFWAKAAAPVMKVQVSFPDIYTDGAANPTALDPTIDPCVYTPGSTSNCSPYLVKFADPQFPLYMSMQIDTTWKRFDILFADTKQDTGNAGYHKPGFDLLDVAHLTAMAIQVNAIYNPDNTVTANDYELWIDDVNFIKK